MLYLKVDERGRILAYRDTDPSGPSLAVYRETERLVLADAPYPPATHYVTDSDEIHERPEMSVALDTEHGRIILADLPVPCTVSVGGEIYQVDDGELEWMTPLPGVYTVEVRAWPYREWRREVEVSAT